MPIDDASPEYPYVQAAAELRRRITAGELGPRLPSQADLAEELGISHMTLKRALALLRDEGLIVGQPGRGTFVRGDGT